METLNNGSFKKLINWFISNRIKRCVHIIAVGDAGVTQIKTTKGSL